MKIPTKRRSKVFGTGPSTPLDREVKPLIIKQAEDWSERHRQPGEHRGPITRTHLEVLKTLLFKFHNSKTGICFPSYETIAKEAGCNRDTVSNAIKILEKAGILTWSNRIARIREQPDKLSGRPSGRIRVMRKSNAYVFSTPNLPQPKQKPSKSENPSGTMNQDILDSLSYATRRPLDPSNGLHAALLRIKDKIRAREEAGIHLSSVKATGPS